MCRDRILLWSVSGVSPDRGVWFEVGLGRGREGEFFLRMPSPQTDHERLPEQTNLS